jgi:flagella synthesis protein FlgN
MNALQQEQAALDQFIELLQQEQAALVAADVDKLQSLSELKQQLSEHLNTLAQQRAAQWERAGFSNDAAGTRAWLATQPPSIVDTWNKLLSTAQTARDLNQTNGQLIQTHMQHNQEALAVLLGAANRLDVYGADGQPLSSPGSGGQRIIGKA